MKLRLGNKESKYPIIQGGMGVGVSMHNLAGNVSLNGGIGVISAADVGFNESDFNTSPLVANLRALEREIKLAKNIAGDDKIIGVNVMVALENYEEYIKKCVSCNVDLIISGAGLPSDLPKYVIGSNTKIAPIVSSLKACKLIIRLWESRYNYTPDMIIVEGIKAGGHLGYKLEEIENSEEYNLEKITKEIVEYVNEYSKGINKNIPVIAAGGIWDNDDIKKYINIGCSGVQMATRFVTTYECDASMEYKLAYINAKKEDIKIIKSPVGMPGRALNNMFIKSLDIVKTKITKCYKCIKTCDIKTTPYCITKALINAVKGNVDNGLIFVGSNVYKAEKIVSVKSLLDELAYNL